MPKMKDRVDVICQCTASGVQASKSPTTLSSSQCPSWESVLWAYSTAFRLSKPMLQGGGVDMDCRVPPLLVQARVDPSGILTWHRYKLIPSS